MVRVLCFLLSAFVALGVVGCGAGSSGSGGGGTGAPPLNAPGLTGIAPSSAVAGSGSITMVAYGSKFQGGANIHWNGVAVPTSCVSLSLAQTACSDASVLTATIPASDLAKAGTAQVTLFVPSSSGTGGTTSNPLPFVISQAAAGSTWVRQVAGISVAKDIAWDAMRGRLYVSVDSTDATHANTIAVIDPVAGSATSFVPAGNGPHMMSISSDGEYLWAGLDGSGTVQRFLLPGLSKDMSFSLPKDAQGGTQEAVALEAAPVSAHTVGLIAGHWGWSPAGDGVYVYDDATARANYVPGVGAKNGQEIDWIQWGADDTKIYGNQYTTIDSGGIATLNVDASGATLASYKGGLVLQTVTPQYDRGNGLLYSYGGAIDPAKLSLMGSFDLPNDGPETCTADQALGRYYCVVSYPLGGTDVSAIELWVFDLNSYALLNRVSFGETVGSASVSGRPQQLVRWGNSGLALRTIAGPYHGNGGIFLIDGAAVNANAAPDVTDGTVAGSIAILRSMTPAYATETSGEAEVTITGNGFSPDSTACWNCNFIQMRFLPTTYISPTQLQVTIPLASVSSTEPLEVSVFDQSLDQFSSNALTFTILPDSGTTQITPVNVCGLSMAWDAKSQLLYVGTADYDGAHPNSIVAVDPATGATVKTQTVEPNPTFVSDSANGEYLYAAYNGATNLTQLALPSLKVTATGPLRDSQGNVWLPGDMKAAPQSPDTVAATLIMPGWYPEAMGGIAVYDDGKVRGSSAPGWAQGQTVPAAYDTLAWSGSDELLTSAASGWDQGSPSGPSPLYQLQVSPAGVGYIGQGTATFDTAGGYLQSDFGTGLIYSEDGTVLDPNTGAIVGRYAAAGLVAPDSSLNRVFFLGQTSAQANTSNYTIGSFNEKTFAPVSTITLPNVSGTPIAFVRWGASGLAILTSGGLPDIYEDGFGMMYLVKDVTFVSGAQPAGSLRSGVAGRVQMRWKRLSTRAMLTRMHEARRRMNSPSPE